MGSGLSSHDDGKAKISLDLLGELVVGLRDEMRELKAAGQKQHNIVVHMLRRIEDGLDRPDELLISQCNTAPYPADPG